MGIGAVTNGLFGGMSGWEWRAFHRGWLALGAFVLAVTTMNLLTIVHDRAGDGRPIAAWEPATWEYSSGASIMLFCIIGYQALRLAPPEPRRWGRFLLVHGVATVIFSALHVATMLGLRKLVYLAAGHTYRGGLSFPYEYRKDLLGYVVGLVIFWLARRMSAPSERTAPATSAPATFDIRDGGRLLRAPVAEIIAVCSAGNYVEFVLADGRKPLMRATLAGVEAQLAPHGLVRTHRSWLVNPGRVRALEAEGSGDYRIDLDGGVAAPLSRRFPVALEILRAGGRDAALPATALMS
jgi:hypothetical protein